MSLLRSCARESAWVQANNPFTTAPPKAIRAICPNKAHLQLYQVHAVTEGTDAQATVTVRMEEDGTIVSGQSADTDTVVASAKAYVAALNRLIVRREAGDAVSYKDVS